MRKRAFSCRSNTFKIQRTEMEKHSILRSLIFSEHYNHWRKYELIISVSMYIFSGQHEVVHASTNENSEHLH
jgi:hypothetical protein